MRKIKIINWPKLHTLLFFVICSAYLSILVIRMLGVNRSAWPTQSAPVTRLVGEWSVRTRAQVFVELMQFVESWTMHPNVPA